MKCNKFIDCAINYCLTQKPRFLQLRLISLKSSLAAYKIHLPGICEYIFFVPHDVSEYGLLPTLDTRNARHGTEPRYGHQTELTAILCKSDTLRLIRHVTRVTDCNACISSGRRHVCCKRLNGKTFVNTQSASVPQNKFQKTKSKSWLLHRTLTNHNCNQCNHYRVTRINGFVAKNVRNYFHYSMFVI